MAGLRWPDPEDALTRGLHIAALVAVGTVVSVTSVKAFGLSRLYGPVQNSVARQVHGVLSNIPN